MLYRFAHCTLDTQLHTLYRAGQSALLSPKVFEVLCYLMAHGDRVISKQELCEQVWRGLAISDATLESCVRAVRTSVGDSGQAQQIIHTQRGYGYRFVAAVETLPEVPPEDAAATASPAALPPDRSTQEQAPTAPTPPPSLRQSEGTTEPLLPGVQLCGTCQYANREDTIFCVACGTQLRQHCSYCGQDIALPAVFCTACGQPLASLSPPGLTTVSAVTPLLSAAASTPPRQGGFSAERKPVTVLCCSVATAAAHGLGVDLDALHSLMQVLHDLARDMVQQYGGWLHPVLGDRLQVTFGVPVVQEDHAWRAVQVALALRQRLPEYQQRFGAAPGISVALRIGLYTGLVVESRWDDAEQAVAVVGDVVSLAVALQAQAEAGQILCSDTTAHLVRETVRLEAVELVQVAGQSAPVAAYAVLGSSMRRTPGSQRWERGLNPFVGREREMATLHALLAQVEAGRGQVVGVVGEAGIGKSRLVAEFYHSLEGRQLTYLTGRCLSYGSATPYLPLLDLLRHNCGITEADGPEDITAKVHRGLQEVDMPPETWAPVFLPLLGVQEGLDQLAALSPEARKARILTAFAQLSLNGSRQRPLVLEIEDLHWIDASSEECLAALVERMAGASLLLLVTSRPGYRPAWIDKSYVTQAALQPLSAEESLRVVQAVLPTEGLSTLAVSRLLAKAEGNPFFLEELARMMVEQGSDAPSTIVPDTVQAVLLARIDRLPASAKRLLQAAAVIGKDVALPLLQALTAVPEEAMHRDLLRLQAAEFLYETHVHAAPVYTFKHVLTQEVASQSLVRRARQQYHERIAQVLEEQFPEVAETQPELLAQHYTEAGRGAQAIPYWQRAGQRAVERSANVEAISHFTKGLEVLQSLPATSERTRQELALQLALGPPLRMIKGETAPELEGLYTLSYELSQQVGDHRQQFSALLSLSRWYLNRVRIEEARKLAEQCFTLAQAVQDPVLLQEGHRRLGAILFFHGELVSAHMHFERGTALNEVEQNYIQASGDRMNTSVTCLCYLAWTLWLLGYPDQALHRIDEALTLAQQSSHTFSLAVALHYAAVLRLARREARLAQELAEETIEFSRMHGFAQWSVGGIFIRGGALIEQGLVEAGIAQLRQAQAAWRAMGKELAQTHIFVRLAEACLQGKRVEEGLQVLTEALHFIHESGERYLEVEVYRLKGALLLQQDTRSNRTFVPSQPALVLTEAENAFRHALAVARSQQVKSLELRAAMNLSRLWQQQGKHIEAYQLLTEVYAWFTEGFETQDLQEAQILLEALV